MAGDSITVTADNTKCARCGRGFDLGEGRYGTSTVPGHFHSGCLYHLDPPSYRSGLLAGLREAADKCRISGDSCLNLQEKSELYRMALRIEERISAIHDAVGGI